MSRKIVESISYASLRAELQPAGKAIRELAETCHASLACETGLEGVLTCLAAASEALHESEHVPDEDDESTEKMPAEEPDPKKDDENH